MDPFEPDDTEAIGELLKRRGLRAPPDADAWTALYDRTDALLLPTKLLPQFLSAVRELNGILAQRRPAGRVKDVVLASDAIHPAITPVDTPIELEGGDAPEVLQGLQAHIRQPDAAGSDDLSTVVASLRVERAIRYDLSITGKPGSKGHGYPGRRPVAVLAPPRRRRPLADLGCGRRPVVAMLDTGVLPHPWFGPIGPTAEGDAFVVQPEDWPAEQDSDAPGPKVVPAPDQYPLRSHAGHGTFGAGLIRQLAPDARVLSIRVMQPDGGIVHEHVLENALNYLLSRVDSGDPDRFVDVVCLALGYREREHHPEDKAYTAGLRGRLTSLGERGVTVVASAGNDGASVETYPAALAADYADLPRRWLHSVGARNPNGTRASYSNYGDWVTDWVVATGLVSSFPAIDAALRPDPLPQRGVETTEGLDLDDFTGGYATWSGTSFAAGALAGRLARLLIADPEEGTSDALLDVSPEAAKERAAKAYAAYLAQQ